jgi:hypothetical protein
MQWLENLTSALPARRDDEPTDLRGKIVSELRDHLLCAYQRELMLTGNETEAVRRVVAKFGDPSAIARRLWLDALKEKIMSQRIMVALSIAMTVACIAMAFAIWRVSERSAEATVAIVRETWEANQALVKMLERAVQERPERESQDWVRLKFHLLKDVSNGSPAAGYRVILADGHDANATKIGLDLSAGSDGFIDAGLLKPAAYFCEVLAPWGEHMSLHIYLRAGTAEQTEVIVCPGEPTPPARFSFAVSWPEDLREMPLGLMCDIAYLSRDIGGRQWEANPGGQNEHIIVAANGDILRSRHGWGDVLNAGSDGRKKIEFKQVESTPGPTIKATGKRLQFAVRGIVILTADPDLTDRYRWYVRDPEGEDAFVSTVIDLHSEEPNELKILLSDECVSNVRKTLDLHKAVRRSGGTP